jgi:membrane protein YdbS with pleckstrin-like domain
MMPIGLLPRTAGNGDAGNPIGDAVHVIPAQNVTDCATPAWGHEQNDGTIGDLQPRCFVIPLNSRQFLPTKAFWYFVLRALLTAAVCVMLGRCAHFIVNSPLARCGGGPCTKGNAGVMEWVFYLLAVVLIVNSFMKFRWFSFTLTERTVNIDSGVFIQSSRAVRFDKIQDVETRQGLLLRVFGLKSVALWTASLDQVRGNKRRPDGLIVLEADTADWLANYLSDFDRTHVALPDNGSLGGMRPSQRSRPGSFGAVIGGMAVLLLAVIAWGLWSKSGGAPPATIAVTAPVAPAAALTPAAVPAPAAASSPATDSQPAQQSYAANMAADPADYTIACSMASGGTGGVPACDSMKWGQRCEREAEFRSNPTSESTRLVIANRSSETLKFFWLDPSGNRAPYAVLPPGRKIGQPSHIGAHWLIAAADGRCVGIFNADTARIGIF